VFIYLIHDYAHECFLDHVAKLSVINDPSQRYFCVIIDGKVNLLQRTHRYSVMKASLIFLEDVLTDLINVFILFSMTHSSLLKLGSLNRVYHVVVALLKDLQEDNHLLILKEEILSYPEIIQVTVC
jgi:hypothetical protein